MIDRQLAYHRRTIRLVNVCCQGRNLTLGKFTNSVSELNQISTSHSCNGELSAPQLARQSDPRHLRCKMMPFVEV
jgi:hypothetical protein